MGGATEIEPIQSLESETGQAILRDVVVSWSALPSGDPNGRQQPMSEKRSEAFS